MYPKVSNEAIIKCNIAPLKKKNTIYLYLNTVYLVLSCKNINKTLVSYLEYAYPTNDNMWKLLNSMY